MVACVLVLLFLARDRNCTRVIHNQKIPILWFLFGDGNRFIKTHSCSGPNSSPPRILFHDPRVQRGRTQRHWIIFLHASTMSPSCEDLPTKYDNSSFRFSSDLDKKPKTKPEHYKWKPELLLKPSGCFFISFVIKIVGDLFDLMFFRTWQLSCLISNLIRNRLELVLTLKIKPLNSNSSKAWTAAKPNGSQSHKNKQ